MPTFDEVTTVTFGAQNAANKLRQMWGQNPDSEAIEALIAEYEKLLKAQTTKTRKATA